MKMKYSILASVALFASSALFAQNEAVRQDLIEITQSKALWYNSSNSAGIAVTPLENYSIVGLGYELQDGDFKMSQQGRKESVIDFGTEGTTRVGDTYLWGTFNYRNITTKNSSFVTNIYDPFRDMPYYISDVTPSKWKKQEYDLGVKAAFPQLWDFVTPGGELRYTTRTGAKQNDPRSVAYYLTVSASPSFVFELSEKSNLGLSLNYEYLFERSTNNRSDTEMSYPVFVMKGLGNYTSGVISGTSGLGTFFYKGNKIGAGLQYGYNGGGSFSALADIAYSYKVEDAFQTPTKKQRMGSTVQNLWMGSLQLLSDGDEYMHKGTISYTDKATDGIEYLQELDTSFEVSQWITLAKYVRSSYTFKSAVLNYELFAKKGSGYNWRAGADVEYSDKFDEYLLPVSTLKAENLLLNVYGKNNFAVGGNSSLLAGVNVGYNANIEGEYIYSGSYETSETVVQMYENDIRYMSSDYLKLGAELCWSTLVGPKTSMFVQARCQYYSPKGDDFSKRMYTDFSVGITF